MLGPSLESIARDCPVRLQPSVQQCAHIPEDFLIELDYWLSAGTGTGGWEAALTNTLSPGDKVVTFRYGQFSHLWVDMQQRLSLDVTVIDCPWGEGAHEDKLEEALAKDSKKAIKAVCVVHNETATGITSDIPKIRKVMDDANHPALLLIDGVSSIGALPFKMDEWGVDVAVTGSQKALSLPTGLSVVCANKKALSKMEGAKLKRVYYDFRCVHLCAVLCAVSSHESLESCPDTVTPAPPLPPSQ
jgi:aspartate aminotransferase-like enzyme